MLKANLESRRSALKKRKQDREKNEFFLETLVTDPKSNSDSFGIKLPGGKSKRTNNSFSPKKEKATTVSKFYDQDILRECVQVLLSTTLANENFNGIVSTILDRITDRLGNLEANMKPIREESNYQVLSE